MAVSVSYKVAGPNVYLVSGKTKKRLYEDTIDQLDWSEIDNCDIMINPYYWEVRGQRGIKAYLKTLYVRVVEDRFAEKWGTFDEDDEVPFD